MFSFIFPILAEESICGIQEHEFEAPKMANDDEKKIHVKHRICYCYFLPFAIPHEKTASIFFQGENQNKFPKKMTSERAPFKKIRENSLNLENERHFFSDARVFFTSNNPAPAPKLASIIYS